MMYRPKSTPRFNQKYDMTVGILPVKDKRVMNFYWYKDDLFEEPIPQGVTDSLYSELRSSRLFKKVTRLKSPLPPMPNNAALQAYKEEHNIDLVISADLVAFNMLREKGQDDPRSFYRRHCGCAHPRDGGCLTVRTTYPS